MKQIGQAGAIWAGLQVTVKTLVAGLVPACLEVFGIAEQVATVCHK